MKEVLITTIIGGCILGAIFLGTRASTDNTRLRTEATVARAQEHTRRAEGRHDLVDVLGWVRGFKAQRERTAD
jgi:hypothetical protein